MKTEKPVESAQVSARERILHAAMQAFMELGYAEASTLEIATRARVSKRELYALFGNKQAMLTECIADRVQRMQIVPNLPQARTREALGAVLAGLGAAVLREVSAPPVMAVFRLAISESQRAPEVAQTLEAGRQSVRNTVEKVLTEAQSAGLLGPGDPGHLSRQFLALLWGDLMVGILLRVREPLDPTETEQRARGAAADFLRLHPASG